MELGERKQAVLRAIVEEYIALAMPIGSKTVADRYGQWSSATIRNDMNELEQAGYLEKPHTSAGRIPSQMAYRFYVDHMMGTESLSPDELEYIRALLLARMRDVGEVFQATASAVAHLTQYAALVAAPRWRNVSVRQLHLVRLDEGRALMVLVTDGGVFKDTVIRIPPDMDEEELDRLSRVVAQRVAGRTMAEAEPAIQELMQAMEMRKQVLLEHIMQAFSATAVPEKATQVVLGGAANLLKHPEYSDIAKARRFLSMLETGDVLSQLMARPGGMRISITIGAENGVQGLEDSSVVSAVYSVGGREVGALGVVGPTRMRYGHVVSLLEVISHTLEEIMGGKEL
nr:heat-inducible transcriptional repressor HrcA [bacterium]